MMRRNAQKGFTLIELLVVIAIIGLLSSIVLASLNTARARARDSRRKADLRQIATALDLYYDKNGTYPTTGATGPGNGGTYSTQAGWLSVLVTDGQMARPGVDPANFDKGPWCWSGSATQNTIYTYASDGQHYILCGWIENTSDKDNLLTRDVRNPWNTAQSLYANNAYSGYNFVIAK